MQLAQINSISIFAIIPSIIVIIRVYELKAHVKQVPYIPEQGCSGYAHMQLAQINSISIFAIIPSIIVIIRVYELGAW